MTNNNDIVISRCFFWSQRHHSSDRVQDTPINEKGISKAEEQDKHEILQA